MINTSSRVKPRVVIFHMTASQLVRSIAPLYKARAVPNAVAHVSDGNARVSKKSISLKMLKGSKLSIVLEASAEEGAAQRETFTRLESSLLAR
jgi:hypothetical protein